MKQSFCNDGKLLTKPDPDRLQVLERKSRGRDLNLGGIVNYSNYLNYIFNCILGAYAYMYVNLDYRVF